MYKRWRQEQVTEEEYRSITKASRYGIRKAKAWLGLKLVRVVRQEQEELLQIYWYQSKIKENVTPLLNGTGDLVLKDMEKA